jgi:hypothetical protein
MSARWGGRQELGDSLTRRGFLRIGALGAGLTLAEWPRARACAGDTPAPAAQAALTIRVGPNVHVSKARPDYLHWEVILAEGIGRRGDLFAASIVHSPSDQKKTGPWVGTVAVYASRNEGKTWVPVLDFEQTPGCFDPALARGPGGEVYFACNETITFAKKLLRIVRSGDGGRTWETSAKIDGPGELVERPFLAVDRTGGKYRGRAYCTAGTSGLFVAPDPARSFRKVRSVLKPHGNPVVLADGTLAALCGSEAWMEQQGYLAVRTSSDGGDSFSEERIVAKYRTVDPWSSPQVMAADPARPGRLYVVWQDRLPSGRVGVLFASSADTGATFSQPVVLSEQPEEAGYDAFVPSVAVNSAGTVAVSWYDRRALEREQAGWDVRLRASADGGKTWGSSARVTEETTLLGKKARTDRNGVGHTAGLAAEGDGGFRCLWVDGRTGVRQAWTASVQIDAARKPRP